MDFCIGEGDDEEQARVLLAALPRLTQLTHLMLARFPDSIQLQGTLAAIPCLHSLWWLVDSEQPLPPGPWLSSLRQLVASASVVMASVPALAAASQLELLGVRCQHAMYEIDLESVLWWAVQHPRLRRVVIDPDPDCVGHLDRYAINAALKAQRQRPDMAIEHARRSESFTYELAIKLHHNAPAAP